MRTYGRITNEDGTKTWVVVQTDSNGFNDEVYAVTLFQCLKLNLNESPFYANYGIPAYQDIVSQIYPDFYVTQTQSQFAQYFASLIIVKQPAFTPTYQVYITTNAGAKITKGIPQ